MGKRDESGAGSQKNGAGADGHNKKSGAGKHGDNNEMSFGASMLTFVFRIIGWLPRWFLYYVVAEAIYFLLYYVARYRVRVSRDNLEKAFPEKERHELRRIERRFYRHLSQVFVDTIDLAGISKKALKRRMVIVNEPEQRERMSGLDWIAVTSHYGSWEYFMVYALGNRPGEQLLGVYKPLHSKFFDGFYRRMRSRTGMEPVPMNGVLRRIAEDRRRGVNFALGMLADQTPPRREAIHHWFDFMGRPTAFFMGTEKLALRFGLPVYFVRVEKVRRAHYRAWLEPLWDGREELEPCELTQRYASRLEEMIRERPEYWMWSHRRWKCVPGGPADATARRTGNEDRDTENIYAGNGGAESAGAEIIHGKTQK